MPTVGKRPESISSGSVVAALPLVLTAVLPNPTITGGVAPALLVTPLVLTPTLPSPTLVRGHAAKVQLVEGDVIRATWFQGLTGSFTDYSLTVSQAVLDSINDWTDLRLRVTATGESGVTGISFAEFTVPAAAAGLAVTVTPLVLTATLPNVSLSAGGSPPEAVIGSPSDGFSAPVGQTIAFDPVGTNDPDGDWVGTWNFGDGTSHTGTFGSYASHVVNKAYSTAGDYIVTWFVLDGEGNSDFASITVHITAQAPVATSLTVSPSSFTVVSGSPGSAQNLSATVLDQFGQPMSGQVVGWVSSNTSRVTVSPSTGQSTTATGQSQTGAVTVTASTPPGGAITFPVSGTVVAPSPLYPNLSLYPQLTQQCWINFTDTLPPVGTAVTSGFGITNGRWVTFEQWTIHEDSTAPVDPPYCMERNFLADTNSGSGRTSFRLAGTVPTNGRSELYEAMFVRWTTNRADQKIELFGPGGQAKFLAFWSTVSQNNPFYNEMQVSTGIQTINSNRLCDTMACAFITQTGVAAQDADKANRAYRTNAGGAMTLRAHRWYRIEVYIKCNTVGSVGNNDGELRWWITDLTTDPANVREQARHTDFKLRTAQKPGGLQQKWDDPIFGGTGGSACATDESRIYAHIFQAWGPAL